MGSDGGRESKQLITPRFFKIILDQTVGQGRLEIPRRFARKFGSDLPSQVFLQVPSGAAWKVELVKDNDGLWLQNGWREFQEYYCIAHGSFLVFEYNGRSYFHVVLLDKSASEIDYPFCANDDCEEPKSGREYKEARTQRNVDDSASVEILDDCLPSLKKRKNPSLPCPQPAKVGRNSFALKFESNSKLHQPVCINVETSAGDMVSYCPRQPYEAKRGNKKVSSQKHENGISKNTKVLGDDGKAEAFHTANAAIKSNSLKNLRRNTCGSSDIQGFTTSTSSNRLRAFKEAAGFKSENPSFSVAMKPAHLKQSYVCVPLKFASDHLKQRRSKVILQISHRKTWTVDYKIYRGRHANARFLSGWLAFVRDNNLETGDVCFFELINPTKLILNVVIDRTSKEKITPFLEPKEKFLLSYPCPADETMRTAKLESSSELHGYVAPTVDWSSSIKSESCTGGLHLCTKLQSEDSCKDRGERGLSVQKYKLSSKNVRTKPLTVGEKANALSRASAAFKSANPFFMVAIQPSYTQSHLYIPFKFARRHLKEENGEIVLQDLNGRAWTVDYGIASDHRKARFKCSWGVFARDNNLVVGDVCIFELIKSSKLVLKVFIIRASDSLPSCGKKSVYEEKTDRQLPERASCSLVPKVVEAAEKFTTMHPSFKVCMTFSSLQREVTVPAKFMKFIKQGAENALMLQLQVGEKTWPVKLARYLPYKIGKLTFGWDVFSRENRLQVGDICAFELVDSESLQLKVTIF